MRSLFRLGFERVHVAVARLISHLHVLTLTFFFGH